MNAQRAHTPPEALSFSQLNYISSVLTNCAKQAQPPSNDGTLSDTAQLITLATSLLRHADPGGLNILRANCLQLASRNQQEKDILEATSLAVAAMEGQQGSYETFIRFVQDKNLAPAIASLKLE